MEPTRRGSEVAFVADGGVDALAGTGQRLTVVDLTPATQALAIGLELRVHRPDLLGAGAVDEDHRDIAEDQLTIVDVPDEVKWHIHEYDGLEHVAEDHRTWS